MQKLAITELGALDARIVAEWQAHLKRIVSDCRDRSSLIKARKLTIKMTVTPDESDPNYVDVGFEFDSDIPSTTTRTFSMRPTGKDDLLFNPESPDEAAQHTIDEEIERKKMAAGE